MRFSRPRREEISLGISMAPLIDIVFLLLIFFMLTSHLDSSSGIDISLPDVSESLSPRPLDNLIVVLDKQGDCYLNKSKISLHALYSTIKDSALGKDIGLILSADKDVKHGRVVEIMDLARKAGVESITISARWQPKENF